VPGGVAAPLVVALLLVVYLALLYFQNGRDPLWFAQVGDGFQQGQPVGTPGYDGQFSYWLAMDPQLAAASTHFDVPAYRYQRILYPLLARLLALGQPMLIPWSLLTVNLAAQVAGTWVVSAWLAAHGLSRRYALTYGLWVGLVAAVRLDLNEPLCYALAAAMLLAHDRGRLALAAIFLGLALFAKETALVFWIGEIVWTLLSRNRRALALFALTGAPFAIYQLLLWRWFGSIGLTSGGWMATSFEWVPYMGLWRVAAVSLPAFALLATILVPSVVAPSVWGILAAARRLWHRAASPIVLALGANAALLAVTPFSTFREPLGIMRLATGLVLCTLLFGAQAGSRRTLNYSMFWIAALALLIKS
jgi:hypothetical protein